MVSVLVILVLFPSKVSRSCKPSAFIKMKFSVEVLTVEFALMSRWRFPATSLLLSPVYVVIGLGADPGHWKEGRQSLFANQILKYE